MEKGTETAEEWEETTAIRGKKEEIREAYR